MRASGTITNELIVSAEKELESAKKFFRDSGYDFSALKEVERIEHKVAVLNEIQPEAVLIKAYDGLLIIRRGSGVDAEDYFLDSSLTTVTKIPDADDLEGGWIPAAEHTDEEVIAYMDWGGKWFSI